MSSSAYKCKEEKEEVEKYPRPESTASANPFISSSSIFQKEIKLMTCTLLGKEAGYLYPCID